MIEEELKRQLFDKIPLNARISIFGAGTTGAVILKDLMLKRKDLSFFCFIDNQKQGEFCDLPIYRPKEFIDKKQENDFVIISSISAQWDQSSSIINILDVFDVPFLSVTTFLFNYYNGKLTFLNEKNYTKASGIFSSKQEKELYDFLFRVRIGVLPEEAYHKYFYDKYPHLYPSRMVIKYQYLEKIIKEKIKTVFDLGFYSGLNAVSYNKILPNCKKIYGFEAIYDICSNISVSDFFDNKVEIIKSAVGDRNGKTEFYINSEADYIGSFTEYGNPNRIKTLPKNITKTEVNMIKLDDFCEERNVYPDLIKMDIEGSELSALHGGYNIIQKARPQLAISLYHYDRDFINIPIYLAENLKDYTFKLGHYSPMYCDTILYAIPNELL